MGIQKAKEFLDKLTILFVMIADTKRAWDSEIRNKDLDEPFCCDGNECGCEGMSIGELWGKSTQ